MCGSTRGVVVSITAAGERLAQPLVRLAKRHESSVLAPLGGKDASALVAVLRRLIEQHRGAWDLAAGWVPVWVGFGPRWRTGEEPLPWEAHRTLWQTLEGYADQVRFHRRLGGVRRLPVPAGLG